jgi:cytochrome c oxidase assembly factor 6
MLILPLQAHQQHLIRHQDTVYHNLLHAMGLFSSSPPPPKISTDGAPIAPDRSQRAKCWEARDAFFQCLEKNSIVDSIGEKSKADKACGGEDRIFERDCASSWVCSVYVEAVP